MSGLRRRDPRPAAHGAAQPELPHQPPHRAARDAQALAPQLPPHFARPVDLVVLVPDALNLDAQLVIALRARRSVRRIGLLRPCAGSTSTGRSAPCAQIGSTPYVSRCWSMKATITSRRRSSSAWAKIRRRLPQNLVGALQFDDSRARAAFNRWRSSVVRPGALAGIALGLAHPPPQRFRRAAQLLGDRSRSPPTATDARRRAPAPAGRRARALRGNTCWVVPWAPSSLRMSPPTNPVRFNDGGDYVRHASVSA